MTEPPPAEPVATSTNGYPPFEDSRRLEAIEARQLVSSARMDRFEVELKDIAGMTRDVHEMLLAWRAGMSALAKFGRALACVGRWLAAAIKFIAPVAAGAAAIYAAVIVFIHKGHP